MSNKLRKSTKRLAIRLASYNEAIKHPGKNKYHKPGSQSK